MDLHLDVIDAFVDGERVDTAALKHALSNPEGRDYFVDVWALREAVQHDPEIAASDRRPPAAARPGGVGRWMIAAGLLAGLAGGYLVGARTPASPAPVSPAAPTASARPTPAREVFPAPVPTRVIQLQFRSDSSGNGGD